MIRQYLEIKKQYPDAILFFRLGDFYEMFFDDALLASRELEITLTGRDGGAKERVPMCGIPYHASDTYIAKLIAKKYRVAICEQVEDPSLAKGIVRREVIRVVTPGTVMEGQLLEAKTNNYLASIAPLEKGFSFAVTDITTGLFMVSSFSGEKAESTLMEELSRLMPAEMIMPLSEIDSLSKILMLQGTLTISGYKDAAFDPAGAVQALKNQFGADCLKTLATPDAGQSIPAAGALLSFISETQKRDLKHIRKIHFYRSGEYMLLDATTRRNLELTLSISDASRKNTLLSVLDYTVTAMGGRLIRNWVEQPLLEIEKIESRLTAIEALVKQTLYRKDLKAELKHIYDLERLAGKISFGTANARDLVALRKSLGYLPPLKMLLEQAEAPLLKETGRFIDPMEEVQDLLNTAIDDDPPTSLKDGGMIKKGFHSEVDRLSRAGREAKNMMAGLEERERARTGIKSLKIGFNKVFGYYIEVTRSYLKQVPEEYRRKQTLANAERFITPELKEYEDLILGSKERLAQLEYSLFLEIRNKLAGEIQRIQRSAAAVARADALYSLAEAAAAGSYTRPQISQDGLLVIKDGRHPVLEQVLGTEQFVPNDSMMDCEKCRLVLITGPNMAGKSTYMRQVALIILMAQIGSFVPASMARIPLVDRIFTRIGASDDLAGGQSTFMVEMSECRSIVKGATKNSLVIMDEVGRGTSTYDGISIARALVEYIHLKIGAKTLFSTHYHELTDLDQIAGIANYNVAVQEDGDDIIFLRKVVKGKADRSYGIHVARLAGLPEEIINRSAEILRNLESSREAPAQTAAARENEACPARTQLLKKNHCIEAKVLEKLRDLDIINLTPMEAINQLHQLRQELEKEI
jgi:DNA mismatch repair protein MutS